MKQFKAVGFRFQSTTPDVLLNKKITLRADPLNKYDCHAIQILANGIFVAYVTQDTQHIVRNLLDTEYKITLDAMWTATARLNIGLADGSDSNEPETTEARLRRTQGYSSSYDENGESRNENMSYDSSHTYIEDPNNWDRDELIGFR